MTLYGCNCPGCPSNNQANSPAGAGMNHRPDRDVVERALIDRIVAKQADIDRLTRDMAQLIPELDRLHAENQKLKGTP